MDRNRIEIIMDLQGRKQVFLIRELGVHQKTVFSWYRNKTQPTIFQLKHISQLLGVTMEELIEQ